MFRAQQILGSKLEEELKAIELPEGVLTENSSPTTLPIKLLPIGDSIDIEPLSGSDSSGPNN